MDKEKKIELLTKVVDGAADAEERAELERQMADDTELRDEYIAMTRIKEVTDRMQFKEMPDSFWDDYWSGIYNNLERGIGWILLTIAVALLSGCAVFHVCEDFFLNGEISILVRGSVLLGSVGLLILIWSIVREVFFARKRERYKEVQR